MLQSGKNIIDHFQEKWFRSLVSGRLIYNTCWEDPRIDRQLLDLTEESNVVMLTSAGCNALDYLLDNPASISCVDSNAPQNALLDLKKALFLSEDYNDLWNFFGKGYSNNALLLFKKRLAHHLSAASRRFWDNHIDYFSNQTAEGSFYFRGTSGQVAHAVHQRIRRKNLYQSIVNLLNADSLEEQSYYFKEVEPQLWNAFYRWLFKRNATMALLGVPPAQKNMIEKEYEGGLCTYIRRALRRVFTQQPLRDNYFWRVYLTGSYRPSCCPNYLKEENFDRIKKRIPRITTHTSSLSDFLRKKPGTYSHFILLDHQDWLAGRRTDLLNEEWELILKNAAPSTRILFRSAGRSCSFLPDDVLEKLHFHTEKADRLHAKGRVGTYSRTFLAEVK